MNDRELEVKYYVNDLRMLEQRLIRLKAQLVQPRTHEINLRFDTPDGDLAGSFQVLRLRQDTAARLTYKGPARVEGGVRVRQEIEFVVSDFEAARALLEALGYQVAMIYEKYRSMYNLGEVHVTLDVLPYGDFVEIEGPDPESIRAVNDRLGLDWDARAPESYVMLFDRLRQEMNLPFRDLSFENFKSLDIPEEIFGLRAADEM
jgi:adenylate cyclase class 2